MRKRTGTRLVALLLSIVMLLSVLPLQAMAVTLPYAYTVLNSEGKLRWRTRNWNLFMEAWGYVAQDGGTLLMHTNTEVSTKLTVESQKPVTVVLEGHTLSRTLSKASGGGEVFLVKPNTSLTIVNTTDGTKLENGKISGGWSSSGGGGIHVQENSTLKLQGVTVTGNKTTDDNGGGGVRLQGKNAVLEMDALSSITGNSAKKGGGVSIVGEGASIVGAASGTNIATISNNKATSSNGGGIHVGAKECSISGVKIDGNEATSSNSYGGGIYMAEGCGCEVTDCTIINNKAHHGGGIYVDGDGSLSYSVIKNNAAQGNTGCGGGIYIDDGNTLHLSGKLSVYGNTATNMERANLYLDAHRYTSMDGAWSNFGYISGEPSGTMEDGKYVYIGWDTTMRPKGIIVASEKKGYDADYLRSDVSGYSIYWSWGTNDGYNDRKLRAGKNVTQSAAPETEYVAVSERYTVTPDGYTQGGKTYDLQQGVYSYKATSGGDLDATYFYSEGYFTEDPKNYNAHLATMSLALTMSAFNAAGTEFDTEKTYNDGYSNRFRNAKQLLSDLGFEDENIHVSDSFLKKPTDFSIGVIMGAKEMELTDANGKPYILLPIAVRGAGYEMEWISNVTLGESGEAAGFSNAADQVMDNLAQFLSGHPELQTALAEGRVKFWVTGFSRSAATANLTAKRLTDQYGEKNWIFSYCFEPPKGGVDSEVKNVSYTYDGKYLNIHNIVNACDIVPYVGPTEMGFRRYGVDHYVPGKSVSSDYLEENSSQVKTNKGHSIITVTSLADNKILPMELDASKDDGKLYTKQRAGMVAQLKLIDDTLIYDDYFSLGTMNFIGSKFGKDMVGELKNGQKTKAHEWIPLMFKNLQEWACNFTWDNNHKKNQYNGDYRGFFSTNVSFAGENHVTVEESLQVAVSLVFGLSDEKVSQLSDAMMYRLKKLDMTSLYRHVIMYWYEKSHKEQQGWISKLWTQMEMEMTQNGQPVPKLSEILSPEEYKALERVFPTLVTFLFQFINYDWWEEPKLSGVDTSQIHLGTLLYNASGLLMNHYPEVVMAWMRTYDSHYMEETSSGYVSANADDPLINNKVVLVAEEADKPAGSTIQVPEAPAPKITFTGTTENRWGETYLGSVKVSISTDIKDGSITNGENGTENGSAIYYRVNNAGKVTPWTLYEGPFEIQGLSTMTLTPLKATVEAYSVRYKDVSETTSASCNLRLGDSILCSVYNNLGDEVEQYCHSAVGKIITFTAALDREIREWHFGIGWQKKNSIDELKLVGDYVISEDNRSVTVVTPEYAEAIFIRYADECSFVDLTGLTPVAGQPLVTDITPAMYSSYKNQTPAGAIPTEERVETKIEWSVPNETRIPDPAEAGKAYTATVTFEAKEGIPSAEAITFADNMVAKFGDSAYGIVTKYSDTDKKVTITCNFPPVAAPALKGIEWPESVSKKSGATTITGAPETVVFDIGGMKIDVPVEWEASADNKTAAGTVTITEKSENSYTVTAQNGVAYAFSADLDHFKGNAFDDYTETTETTDGSTETTVTKNVPLIVEACTVHSGDWKYDGIKHWKVCSTPDCGVVFDEAAHIMSGWTEDAGSWVKSCSECGYKETVPIYEVTFDAQTDGAEMATRTTNENSKLTALANPPVREGYSFLGWFTEQTGGTQITTETEYTANTTVYAQWIEIKPTCNHSETKYIYDSTHHQLVCASCGEGQKDAEAHTMGEWKLNENKTQWTASCECGYTDTEAAITVTFNANGGTGTDSSSTAKRDGTLEKLPDTEPTRDGYTFLGWFTASTGGKQVTTDMVFTQDTTVFAQWHWTELPLAQPTVDLAPGTYNETKTVTISHPMEGVELTITCNDEPISGNQVTLPAGDPDSNTQYSIEVTAEKAGYTKSTATFSYTIAAPASEEAHQLTVVCEDVNLDEAVTSWDGMPADFRTTYNEGETVTVPAPVFANMQFVEWDVDGATLVGEKTDTVAAFKMTDDVTLTATYKPIIRNINLTLDGLENGKTLPTVPTAVEATIADTYQLDPTGLELTWVPADGKINPGTNYTATIAVNSLKLADGTSLDMENVIIDGSTKLTVNGESGRVEAQGDGSYRGVWSFTSASVKNPVITDIEVPDKVVNLERDEMSSVGDRLPRSVSVTVDPIDSGITSVNVNWAINEAFDPNLPEAQQVEAVGTLQIPENVTLAAGLASSIDKDPTKEGIQIKIVFYTSSATRAATPTATPSGGTFKTEPFVQLATETEGAVIYYTLDGSDPTETSTKYTGGFGVKLGQTVKAIAVKDGMFESHVASFTYTKDSPQYSITIAEVQNGTVKASAELAASGTTVVVNVSPDDGYTLDTLAVRSNNREVSVTAKGGKYQFIMPGGDTTITASFTKVKQETPTAECPKDESCPMYPFTDLDRSLWYHDGVHYCIEHELMNGMGENKFEPNDTTTRAMIVTILWRLEGKPTASDSVSFDDVPAGKWYTEAIRWAASEKLVEGYGDGKFGTEDPITREQMVTMMHRYAKHKGYNVSEGENNNILSYSDFDDVSEWAIAAMQWGSGSGIINGIPDGTATKLDPHAHATRAQSATILQRYCEKMTSAE